MHTAQFSLSMRQWLDIWVANVLLTLKNNAAVNIFVARRGVLTLHHVPEPPGELVKTRMAKPHPQTL